MIIQSISDSGFESIEIELFNTYSPIFFAPIAVMKVGKTFCGSKRLGLLGLPNGLEQGLGQVLVLVLHDGFEDIL